MKIAWVPVVKAIGFCLTGVLCASFVVNTLSVPVRGDTDEYTVEFTDVEGLGPGNPVTMAGVRVGRVDSIAFADAGGGTSKAVVGIEVESGHTLSREVTAAVRYGDMLGARYIALTQPAGAAIEYAAAGRPAEALSPGEVIPISQTTPPVDLTALMNGFRPLFDALAPDQVNTLTRGFVETFSGKGQTIATLLSQIGSLSTSLAGRQDVIKQLVDNLAALLGAVNARAPQLEQLLAGLSGLSTSVAGNSDQLVALLGDGNRAVAQLAQSMARSNGAFGKTVTDLKSVTDSWIASTDEFNAFVAKMPEFGAAINRMGSYGGFVNLYLCNFTLKAGDLEANIFGPTHSQVCS
ncbi:MCE family protein [Rhodococcus spelaei]|uniref:MCE family protein n=1 Tax=Rhodococcus spelaei TaxID=2546320 RepID=A0A541B8Z5_9NOCA|nr:MlaD family protein [Rhodococcus spelaei]TQF68812.1 MCE family protein [Rhodococcus spelaei]